MAVPKITAEIAFDGGPYHRTYHWTDVTDYLRGFSVKRGRNTELDRIETGTMTLKLDNSDGRFTPGRQYGPELFTANMETGSDTLGTTAGFVASSAFTLSSFTSGNVISGTRIIRATGTPAAWASPIGSADTFPVKAGSTYRLSFWARNATDVGNPAVGLNARIHWVDGAGNWFAETDGTYKVLAAASGTWELFEVVAAAPAGAVAMAFRSYAWQVSGGLHIFYYDNVSFKEVSPFWPNVVPRRRVRVRSGNLLPKDLSTCGDISRSAGSAQSSRAGTPATAYNMGLKRSGSGSYFLLFNQALAGAFSSAHLLGYPATSAYGAWSYDGSYRATNPSDRRLARVTAGTVYTASGYWWANTANAVAETFRVQMIWYDVNLGFVGVSPAVVITSALSEWRRFTLTSTAPAGAAFAAIEIGSDGTLANVNGFIDELQLEVGTVATDWVPGGSIFSGTVESWPVTTDGLTAEVEIPCVDPLAVLGRTEMVGAFKQEILTSAPWGYWPLAATLGATAFQNMSLEQYPAIKAETVTAGGDSLIPSDSDGGSVTFGSGGQINGTNWTIYPFPGLGTQFSALFVFKQAATPNAAVLFRANSTDGGLAVEISQAATSGLVTLSVRFADGTTRTVTSDRSPSSAANNGGPNVNACLVGVTVANGVGNLHMNSWRWQTATNANQNMRQINNLSLGSNMGAGPSNGAFAHWAVWTRFLDWGDVQFLGYYTSGSPSPDAETVRFSRLIRNAGFTGEALFDPSVAQLARGEWGEGTSPLTEVQQAAEDARGYVFSDGDGILTYHNVNRRTGAPVRFVLGDSVGLPYEPGISFEMSDDLIINEVTFTRKDGVVGAVRDAFSIDAFGRKTKTVNPSLYSDAGVVSYAQATLAAYKQPAVRCDGVTLNCTATEALFGFALGVEIGDRITLVDLPAQAPAASMDWFVEGVTHDVTASGSVYEWTTALSLSPVLA